MCYIYVQIGPCVILQVGPQSDYTWSPLSHKWRDNIKFKIFIILNYNKG